MNPEPQPKTIDQKVADLKSILESKLKPDGKFNAQKYGKCVEFADQLKKKYPPEEIVKARLFHTIALSTTDATRSPNFDLPEGEVEKFIREEL